MSDMNRKRIVPDKKWVNLIGKELNDPNSLYGLVDKVAIQIPNDKDYDTINKAGKKHFRPCDKDEMHTFKRMGDTSNTYKYVLTIQAIEDCPQCKEELARREENKRIAEEARKFKDSIEVKVGLCDNSLSYEWSEAEIGKSPDGRLWIRYGAGCSCNSIGDEEWVPFTEARQANEAVRHIGGAPHKRAEFIADAWGLLSDKQA